MFSPILHQTATVILSLSIIVRCQQPTQDDLNKMEIKKYWDDVNCKDYPMSVGKFISFNQLDSDYFYIWWYNETMVSTTHRLMLFKVGPNRNRLIPHALTKVPVDPLSPSVNQSLSFAKMHTNDKFSIAYGLTFRGKWYALHLRKAGNSIYDVTDENKVVADKDVNGFNSQFLADSVQSITGGIRLVAVSSNPMAMTDPDMNLIWVIAKEANLQEKLIVRATSTSVPLYSNAIRIPADVTSLLITTAVDDKVASGLKALYIDGKYSFMVTALPELPTGQPPLSVFGHFNHRSYLSNDLIGCPNVFCYSIEMDSIYEIKMFSTDINLLKINSGQAQWTRRISNTSANVPFELPTVTKDLAAGTLDALGSLEEHADAVFANVKSVNNAHSPTVFRGAYVSHEGSPPVLINTSNYFNPSSIRDVDTIWYDYNNQNSLYAIKGDTVYRQNWSLPNLGPTKTYRLNITGLPINIEAALSLDGIYYFFKNNFYFSIEAEKFGNVSVGEPMLTYSRKRGDPGFFGTYGANGIELCDYTEYGYTAQDLDDEMDKYSPSLTRKPTTTTIEPSSIDGSGSTGKRSTVDPDSATPDAPPAKSSSSTVSTLMIVIIIVVVIVIALIAVMMFVASRKSKSSTLVEAGTTKKLVTLPMAEAVTLDETQKNVVTLPEVNSITPLSTAIKPEVVKSNISLSAVRSEVGEVQSTC